MITKLALSTILVLILAGPASAESVGPALFLELARDYRPEERHRLPGLRARLSREIPDLLARPLPPCPLRSALAKALTPNEARALLAAPYREIDLLVAIVNNLASRPDLASLVLETGAYDRLEPAHALNLAEVAANALLDGDDRLVRRLLSGPGMKTAAEMLSRLPHPEGFRTLADVVTGTIPIPATARARLALFEPDVYNPRPVRPLGPERVEALVRTVSSDPDHAIRALAARILFRAYDPTIANETVRAFVHARSTRLNVNDWHHLAKFAPAPVIDPRVSIEHRLDMLESWLLWSWVRAENEPLEAEAHAAVLRRALATAGPRFRGEAIVMLFDHVGVFVTTTDGRKRPVPSFLSILADLESGRPSDPPPLTTLGREAASLMRAEISEEEGYPAVRVRERPLASEAAWRPCPRNLDTALAVVVDEIDSLERYVAALALVEDRGLPPDSRHRLFESLQWIAREGGPAGPGVFDAEEATFDRRYFDRLSTWLVEHAPSLDADLPEAVLGSFSGRYPEGQEKRGWEAFDRAIERVPPGGPRTRLDDLKTRSLEWR